MLVDAAKQGDVEIPYFCYEPKLGKPVGACRMCLVEIEGIPKLQTSCSTPVKDGMVVHTQTDRVRDAQNAVVEFLLVNHPLDCPVCDKGGECPLQDITFGWGLGRSRMIEPKRHFEKPLALSPLVAIDRERCILCYRCVRFSPGDRRGLPADLHRARRPHVRRHPRRPPVRRAVQRQHHRAVPGRGARPRQPYRFRARPWDIEGAGGICTLCPSQCNVTFTVRDERVMRVLSRDDDHAEVDDGWLCDKGRFAYQAIHVDERITRPLVRDGGELREVSWERALETAAGLAKHRGRVGALVGGQALQRGGLPAAAAHAARACGSDDIDSRGGGGDLRRQLPARWPRPALQATVPDIEFAHTVLLLGCEPLDDAPILDLRIRKGVRRNGVKLAVASARPTHAGAQRRPHIARYAPGRRAPSSSPRCTARSPARTTRPVRARRHRPGRPAARRRRGRRDPVGRAARRRARRRAAADRRPARPRRPRRRRAARDPGRRQRPRPARGGRGARRRPGLRELDAGRSQRGRDRRGRGRRRRHRALPLRRPIRSATCPTARCGSARCTPPASSSPTPRC